MPRHRLAREITRPDHDVRAIQSADDRGSEGGIVLAIRIDCEHRGRTLLESRVESSAQGRPFASVLVELDRFVGHGSEQLARAIGRAIIDADYQSAGQVATHILYDLRECRLVVILPAYNAEPTLPNV